MRKIIKEMITNFVTLLIVILPFMLVILWIIALLKYANTPITEVPLWAYIFLRGGK